MFHDGWRRGVQKTGGVRKEFFQLLLEQLYDVNYGMFTYNEDKRQYWFNIGSFENNLQYELFGTLIGWSYIWHVIPWNRDVCQYD